MPVKDHYRTLEVSPDASLQEIKKAWRRLAHMYHPDKDTAGRFSTAYFHDLQEAYDVLSDSKKRAVYDEERWLDGYARKRQPQIITPQWILGESRKLSKHMATVDTFRMNHTALHDYVFLLLSDAHMAILQQAGDADTNHSIVREILKAVKAIQYNYMKKITARLALLAAGDEILLQQIHTTEQRSHRHARWEKYKPAVIISIAILLCILMFLYAHIRPA